MTEELIKLLLIDDDVMLSTMLAYNFKNEGFDVTFVSSFSDALAIINGISENNPSFALVLLDISLPDGSGLDLLKQLKKNAPEIPVLILSGKASETDRVTGLDLGADDYLCKPFSLKELQARVHALLRRTGKTHERK
ncbi:MAG TPA: response regulator transcription factor [Candidatus Wallbacteria bacterium]|nr:MAG: Transcriptional regulatory protein WalR [bacterium ADurb.Bin243]HOD39387.1 response regulator transcription factor [Candidatus Wallbacteria bacterium]HPG58174.1 response regulator transcription factor [Candidatus Wallbacteria bacterium]